MTEAERHEFPLGQRVTLVGHFDLPVVLEEVRPLGSGLECRVRPADRIVIHFLPKYVPDLNSIERIWRHLHEEITRNRRVRTMDELLDLVFEWLQHRRPFEVERDAYLRSRAA